MTGILSRHWFAVLLVHAFMLQTIMMMLRIGTTYHAISLGIDVFWIGVIGGAFGVAPAIFGLHLGRYIDHFGEYVSLIVGSIVVLSAALAFLFAATTLVVLILTSSLLGLGQFLCIAGQHSAVGGMATDERRDINFGWLTVAISIAHGVGPGIVALLGHGEIVPDTGPIFITGVVASSSLLAVGLLLRMPPHIRKPPAGGVWHTARVLLRTRGFTLSVIAAMITFAAMDLLVIYLPVYGTERGIPAEAVGTLLALRAVASVLSRVFFGRLMQFLGRGPLLVVALLISGISIALLPVSDAFVAMASLLFVAGLGLGLGAPLTLAWVTEISPAGMRASGLSIRLAVNRIGQAALPMIVGAISGIGATGVLLATSVTLLSTSAVSARYFGFFRR